MFFRSRNAWLFCCMAVAVLSQCALAGDLHVTPIQRSAPAEVSPANQDAPLAPAVVGFDEPLAIPAGGEAIKADMRVPERIPSRGSTAAKIIWHEPGWDPEKAQAEREAAKAKRLAINRAKPPRTWQERWRDEKKHHADVVARHTAMPQAAVDRLAERQAKHAAYQRKVAENIERRKAEGRGKARDLAPAAP